MSHAPVILICLHADPTQPSGVGDGGGTHAYLRELATGLAARGRCCHLVTRRQAPGMDKQLAVSPLTTLHRIDLGPDGFLDKRHLNESHDQSVAAIDAVIHACEPFPALLHSVYWNSGRAAMDLARRHGIPFVHTVISNGIGRRERGAEGTAEGREAIERQVFHAAARIFSISQAERRDLVRFYGVDPAKIQVVGRPVDAWFMDPAQDETGQPRGHWMDSSLTTGGTP